MPGTVGPSLVIDASTVRGSVALVTHDRLLADETVATRGEHAERLLPAVAQLLDRSDVRLADLSSVVCGTGPGSFTSLRVAAAIAKGLVVGGNMHTARPLASVPSLALIVAGAIDRLEPGLYLASADALRGERYAALMEVADHEVRPIGTWRRLAAIELAPWAEEVGAHVIGPGCTIDAWPKASGVTRLWPAVVSVDPASWEPDYGRLAEAEVRRLAAAPRGTGT
jgi:tRNA threonylcarbamoyladenosine biosynthesis protein TsaB